MSMSVDIAHAAAIVLSFIIVLRHVLRIISPVLIDEICLFLIHIRDLLEIDLRIVPCLIAAKSRIGPVQLELYAFGLRKLALSAMFVSTVLLASSLG